MHLSTGSLRFDRLYSDSSLLADCQYSRRIASPDESIAVDRPRYCLSIQSLIGLMILIFSKKAGSEFRRFIARNFYRSKYDYRARWLEVTKTFAGDNQRGDHRLSFRPLDQGFSDHEHFDLVIPRSRSPVPSVRPIAAESRNRL